MRGVAVLLVAFSCFVGAGCLATSGTRVFKIPSSAMEPTLHCAKPVPGCLGSADDRVVVRPGKPLQRGDIVVFRTPPEAAVRCGTGGLFVKRLIGLPGEMVHEDAHGFISVDGKRLTDPYVPRAARREDTQFAGKTWHVPARHYFMVGDNRPASCDSRVWGSVPAHNVIGPVVKIIRGH
jgi:signal peptidase I